MTVESLLGVLIIGALAGWIAGLLVRGKGQGLIMNMVVGIVGAFIGTLVFSFFGLSAGGHHRQPDHRNCRRRHPARAGAVVAQGLILARHGSCQLKNAQRG